MQGSKVIRRKVDESVESAFGVLRKRISLVAQPNIQKLESGQILVEPPGAKM
jgi:SecD/SecF fusion protein